MKYHAHVLTGPESVTSAQAVAMRPSASAMAGAEHGVFFDLNSPQVLEMLRGYASTTGITVTTEMALHNPTVFRCVDLICGTMAMMPLKVHRDLPGGGTEVAKDHPLHRVLHRRPNDWQTPFEFKGLMQYRALVHRKGSVALIVRGARGPSALLPLNPDRVEIELTDDFKVRYQYTRKNGGRIDIDAADVFHLRGLTFDGINGLSRVEKAADSIAISRAAERATASLFENGTFASGALKLPNELSQEAYDRLVISWQNRHTGSANAGSTPILEGGADYEAFSQSAREAQSTEARRFQVEETLRFFGVPRPLAMLDDTGWGTGIEQLSIGFVRFGLNPWIRAWEEGIDRSALTDREDDLGVKFNTGALMNGTLKDQFEAFAKASGAGGHRPWYTPNEIRAKLNEPPHPDGDDLGPAPAPPPSTGDTETDEAAERALAARKGRQKPQDADDED